MTKRRCAGARPRFWFVWLILLWISSPGLAQVPTGAIRGEVKDTSGAVVPGAIVTVRNVDTAQTRKLTSGDDGAYLAPELPIGNYEVRAEHVGFRTETRQGLTLNVSDSLLVNFTLAVGTTQQEVTVTGEAPLVNTENSTLGGLVNEQQTAELPLNGRNYMDLSLLQPGITKDVNQGQYQGASTQYSSNGAPVRSNNFTLDGAPIGTLLGRAPTSESGDSMGVDGIKEFKVITSNFSAEYGMTMGSQMAMVSKNGTNQFHGDAFEYLRNSALDSRNYFDLPPRDSTATGCRNSRRITTVAPLAVPSRRTRHSSMASMRGFRRSWECRPFSPYRLRPVTRAWPVLLTITAPER